MACRRCGAEKQEEFGAEVNIHHPGLRGLDEPDVLLFPKLVVCRNCGFAEFTLSDRQLSLLAESDERATMVA